MTQADRPWWATDGDVADGPDEDPLDAHRAARRGGVGDGSDAEGPSGDDGTWWVPATEAVTRLARDLAGAAAERAAGDDRAAGTRDGAADEGRGAGSAAADGDTPDADARSAGPRAADGGDGEGPGPVHRVDACGVCPICVGLRAIGEVRPDLVVHLAEAARQLALAVRTVVDAAAPDGQPAASGTPPARDAPRRAGTEQMHRIDLDD